MKLTSKIIGMAIAVGAALVVTPAPGASAAATLQISPPSTEIVLQPGQTYRASFRVHNNGDEDLDYKVYVEPYTITSDAVGVTTQVFFESDTATGHNTIVDWISVDTATGTIAPGDENTDATYINYTITVPVDATPGGQYAAIMVEQVLAESEIEDAVGVISNVRSAFLIYATVAGNLDKTATVENVNIPGVVLSGKITATSLVENAGNVHGTAEYTLQVFPLFSDEEVYTNAENPETHIIYPGTKFANVLTYDETPGIGIFRVVETVALFGDTTSTERIVLVLPFWLLLLGIFVIVFVIMWLVLRSKKRREKRSWEKS